MGTRRAQMLTFPAWTATNIGITSLQVLSACTSGIGEANGDNAGYSKFADATASWNVPSRVGMCIIYIAGLLVSMWVIPSAESPRTIMIAWMLFGHYLKREVEVMCVHKYSGQIHLPSSCMISVAYGLAALGVSHFTEDAEQQLRMASRHREQQQLDSMDVVAAVLYVIGQLGNGCLASNVSPPMPRLQCLAPNASPPMPRPQCLASIASLPM